MDRSYEIERIWNLCIYHYDRKSGRWQDDNCPVVQTSYGKLEKLWKSLTKAMPEHRRDELMKQIEDAIKDQTAFRQRQRASSVKVSQPVGITVWMGEKRWMNKVEIDENREKPTVTLGKCWKCDRPVHGPAFKGCFEHLG